MSWVPHLDSPLAKRIVKIVLGLYFMVAISLTVVQLLFEFFEQKNEIYSDIQRSINNIEPVIAEAMWNFDDTQVEKTVTALMAESFILGIVVYDSDDQQLQSVGIGQQTKPAKASASQGPTTAAEQVSNNNLARIYDYTFPLQRIDNGEASPIGKIAVFTSYSVVLEQAMGTFIITIVNALIKTLVLWLIFVAVLNKFVAKPLHQVTDSIRALPPKLAGEKVLQQTLAAADGGDEMDLLTTSFFEMEEALVKQNRELQDYQRNLEEKVTDRTRKLAQAAEAKSLFLATMSHEIRTPMNGMLGIVELLKSTTLADEQARYLDLIYSSGDALLAIINNVLDYSKIEAGKMSLEIINFDLHKLVEHTIALFAVVASNKKINLVTDIEPDVPRMINSDPTRLRQIINNLVSNAIKFTEYGTVVLRISTGENDIDGNDFLNFEVEDSGIGMDRDQIENLFQSFTQADSSTTRKYGGTGLGLSISKFFIEKMGGSVEVTSSQGKGSTFKFTIQTHKSVADHHDHNAEYHGELEGTHLLVIDDDAEFVEQIKRAGKLWQIEIEQATSGSAAIATVLQSKANSAAFDYIVLGLHAVAESQTTVVAELLQAFGTQCPPIVISYPLNDTPAVEPRYDDVVRSYLEKPAADLAIHAALSAAKADIRNSDKGRPIFKSFAEIRTLVADDNEVNQIVTLGMLKRLQITADVATNGLMAIEAFKKSDKQYDVVLMDCEMPELDGWQATKSIREWEAGHDSDKRTIIVGLSAHAMPEHRDKGQAVGMDNYLNKPTSIKDLYGVFREFSNHQP